MRFIEALQKSEAGGAQRKVSSVNKISCFTIFRTDFSIFDTENRRYGLSREVYPKEGVIEGVEANTWYFHYLTDLFAMAKQQGFFHDIDPNAPDWYIADREMITEAEGAWLNNYFQAEVLYNLYASND